MLGPGSEGCRRAINDRNGHSRPAKRAWGGPERNQLDLGNAMTALENALVEPGIRVVRRKHVAARTAELDLTLSGQFDPRLIPAYQDLTVANGAIGIALRPMGTDRLRSAPFSRTRSLAPW